MMTLCNWLRRVFAQKTSNLESTTGYRTTKEGFGIYPTPNRSLIFILRTTPHPCRCCRATKIGRSSIVNSHRKGEGAMIKAELTLPEIGLIAVTRGLLGAGIALLLADKLSAEQRKAIGWTLVGVGALTTIPLAIEVFSKRQEVWDCEHRPRSVFFFVN